MPLLQKAPQIHQGAPQTLHRAEHLEFTCCRTNLSYSYINHHPYSQNTDTNQPLRTPVYCKPCHEIIPNSGFIRKSLFRGRFPICALLPPSKHTGTRSCNEVLHPVPFAACLAVGLHLIVWSDVDEGMWTIALLLGRIPFP